MFKWFIRHQWKEFSRSNVWQKSIAINILLIFFAMLMLLYALLLGLFLDKILTGLFPDQDPMVVFNSSLLYYLSIDLFIRYFMQTLPTIHAEAYLHLPVKRSSLVNFIIFRSLVNLMNYIPWLIFIPFAIKVLPAYHPDVPVFLWIIAMIFLVYSNNFLAILLKRQVVSRPRIPALVGLLIISLMLLDYYGLLTVSDFSATLFNYLLVSPVFMLVITGWLVFLYWLNYSYLQRCLYPEEINLRKAHKLDRFTGRRYFRSMGITGELISLEFKLWWRHKRTKSMIMLLPLFILYGLFFYPQSAFSGKYGMLIFIGVFTSGGMMMNYLNYAFGYESNYFDGVLSRAIDMKKYLKAKFFVGIIIAVICYIVTIPYVFFGTHILAINTATFLFNIGFLSYALLYTATFNKKKMDLSKGAAFNYQGVGASNFIVLLPGFLLPVLIFAPFGWLDMPYTGMAILAAVGIAGMLFHEQLLNIIYKNFKKKRYLMAEGFRK